MAQGAITLLQDKERMKSMRDEAGAPLEALCSTLVLPQYVKYYESVLTGG